MDESREVDTLIIADDTLGWDPDAWAADPPELVISLGDLATYDLAAVRDALPEIPLVGVLGNHDTEHANLTAHGGVLLTGPGDRYGTRTAATGRLLGSRYLAVGGCVRYKPAANEPRDVQYTQDEYAEALGALDPGAVAAADIVVCHCPPAGINDGHDHAHLGIEALDPLVRAARPRYLLHGHTHPDPGETVTGYPGLPGTEVIYVYGATRRNLLL